MSAGGIYIHIPFCVRKCFYCDFYSIAADDYQMRKGYTRALLKEIGFYGQKYGREFKADSIFFGGGTPSLMEPQLMEKIMDSLRKSFNITPGSEITVECNPATLSADKLRGYRQMGVNRLSIGAQSFDDKVLELLGRIHRAEDVVKTVNTAREAGFDNISLDLMFAVPGLGKPQWRASLKKAFDLKPEHLSFYSLEIAEDTAFGRMKAAGRLKETSAKRDREMYETAFDMAEEAGYKQYEISNASLPGRECRHNLKYWDLSEYMGLGAAAHSFIKNVRYANIDDVNQYAKAMWSQDAASAMRLGQSDAFGADCVASYNVNTFADNASEYAFTALRTSRGIVFEDFEKKVKSDFWEVYALQKAEFERFVRDGYAISDRHHIALTRKGMNISNRIMALFV